MTVIHYWSLLIASIYFTDNDRSLNLLNLVHANKINIMVEMVYSSTPYVGMAWEKMAVTLEVHKWHAPNVCITLIESPIFTEETQVIVTYCNIWCKFHHHSLFYWGYTGDWNLPTFTSFIIIVNFKAGLLQICMGCHHQCGDHLKYIERASFLCKFCHDSILIWPENLGPWIGAYF